MIGWVIFRNGHFRNTLGFIVKKWGFFLVVWLTDRRLAVIDTRNFQPDEIPELGTFIECETEYVELI